MSDKKKDPLERLIDRFAEGAKHAAEKGLKPPYILGCYAGFGYSIGDFTNIVIAGMKDRGFQCEYDGASGVALLFKVTPIPKTLKQYGDFKRISLDYPELTGRLVIELIKSLVDTEAKYGPAKKLEWIIKEARESPLSSEDLTRVISVLWNIGWKATFEVQDSAKK